MQMEPSMSQMEILQHDFNARMQQAHEIVGRLNEWKRVGENKLLCPQEVLDLLNMEVHNWRSVGYEHEMDGSHIARIREAQQIIQRCKNRGGMLPVPQIGKIDTPENAQEHTDAVRLALWKFEIESRQSVIGEAPQEIQDYLTLCELLDIELRGWRQHIINVGLDIANAAVSSELEIARGIYNRYVARQCQMPQQYGNTEGDAEKEQETRDAMKLNEWKQALQGNGRCPPFFCPDEVCMFLDESMPLWRDKLEKQMAFNQKAMMYAAGIVERYENRGKILPVRSKECKADPSRAQEYRDAAKLNDWKQSLKGHKTKTICCDEVRAFLDERMPNWREVVKETHNDPMAKAIEIVERYRERGNVMPREWREHRNDPVRAQEYKDASKLRNWKRALKGNGTHNCPDAVRDYLDREMPNWRKDVRKKYCSPMETARAIVERYNQRNKVLPRHFSSNRKDPDRQQEYKDAKKLYDWKQGLKGLRFYRCSPELKEYLDANLPGWNDGVYSKASLLAEAEKTSRITGHGDMSSETGLRDDKMISVSLPVTMNISDTVTDGDNDALLDAKKRMREDELHMQQLQDVHDHRHKQLAMMSTHDGGHMSDGNMDHILLHPPSKVPRVMETKEV